MKEKKDSFEKNESKHNDGMMLKQKNKIKNEKKKINKNWYDSI